MCFGTDPNKCETTSENENCDAKIIRNHIAVIISVNIVTVCYFGSLSSKIYSNKSALKHPKTAPFLFGFIPHKCFQVQTNPEKSVSLLKVMVRFKPPVARKEFDFLEESQGAKKRREGSSWHQI